MLWPQSNSSGIPVGAGGKRGPSTGVRISAKRQRAPLVLSPEQVKQDLAEVQFRDQLLVFLIGALGTRRGEVGALRCDGLRLRQPGLLRPTLLLLAQERVLEGDQNGSICETSGDASALKNAYWSGEHRACT